MDSGIDFLRQRVNEAVAQHQAFVRALGAEEAQANDERVRDLCARFQSRANEHQRMLTQLAIDLRPSSPSAPASIGELADVARRAVGAAVGAARELADAPRPSDFDRLVAICGMSEQVELSFRTFRDAGRELRIPALARVGELAERHHDDFARDAKRLVEQLFVERARGAEHAVGMRSATSTDVGR